MSARIGDIDVRFSEMSARNGEINTSVAVTGARIIDTPFEGGYGLSKKAGRCHRRLLHPSISISIQAVE